MLVAISKQLVTAHLWNPQFRILFWMELHKLYTIVANECNERNIVSFGHFVAYFNEVVVLELRYSHRVRFSFCCNIKRRQRSRTTGSISFVDVAMTAEMIFEENGQWRKD